MTCHTLEEFYHIDGHPFEKQYKEALSGFRQWEQLEHADEWLLFPGNIGPRLAIDESSLSNGELYTFVTNRDARTREQFLVAVVAGTKAEDVIAVLQRIDEGYRNAVEEVTLDLSDSMRKIVRKVFHAQDCPKGIPKSEPRHRPFPYPETGLRSRAGAARQAPLGCHTAG